MKFEDIQNLWEEDCSIDRTRLGDEALKIPKLHSKYYKIFTQEVMRLRKMEAELKELRLEKWEFLTLGPTQEALDKGWRLPPQGKILKNEVELYLDTDKDIVDKTLKVGVQKEKAKFLEAILKELNGRNFHIRAAIDWERFRAGN